MNNVFAKILTSFPIDSAAAKVTGNGTCYAPNKIVCTNDSDFPIATRSARKSEIGQSSFVDLSGYRFGRFVVIGIAKNIKANWVVKCSCGKYSTRTAKAIKNPKNNVDCCEHCRHLAYLKSNIAYRMTGKELSCRGYA